MPRGRVGGRGWGRGAGGWVAGVGRVYITIWIGLYRDKMRIVGRVDHRGG